MAPALPLFQITPPPNPFSHLGISPLALAANKNPLGSQASTDALRNLTPLALANNSPFPSRSQVSTDALRNVMKAQLEAQGEERPDLEQGYHERQVLRKDEVASSGPRRSASSTTPRSGTSSAGSGKWRVEIDIPVDPRDGVSGAGRVSGRGSGAVSRSSSGGGAGVHPKVVAAIESGDGKSAFGSLLQKEVGKSPLPSPRNGPGQ